MDVAPQDGLLDPLGRNRDMLVLNSLLILYIVEMNRNL